VVQELFADRFSVKTIREELGKILPNGEGRSKMLSEYDIIDDRLGNESAP
jgi:lipid-A-disaccharide synthase